ncbi:hypothetical protein [Qipengyuania sp. JC766]|uniref:hypothetical protein n=1 Tax=Qipengyuania sp. JC766 TaxID=3232139 RepID=UPI0034575439
MTRITPVARFALAASALPFVALAQPAFAEGVPAGTSIDNTAEATYTVGGQTVTVPSNTVSITVDEILDVVVTSLDGGNVALTNNGAVLTFQVTNTGNGPEAFNIDVDPAIAGDDFDPAIIRIAYDSDGNGIYEAGVDAEIALGGATPEIPADGSLRIFVITDFGPNTPQDGQTADVRLTATAATGNGAPGTVFTGDGANGTDAVIGSSTAQDDDLATLLAQLAAVTLSKSAVISDPFGGSQPVPGATVTYSLVASVAGSASIADLVVNDPIPANTTYSPNTLTLGGATLTDAADADAGQAGSTGISVDLGTVAGGESRTITFQVTIEQ